MAEETKTMATGDDPADFTVEAVNAYLKGLSGADADAVEALRVLEAEEAGKARVGILEGSEAPEEEPTPAQPVGQGTVHQDGAPEALTKVADKAAEDGYLGTTPTKPDYSQANPAVMNQEG